MSSGTGYTWKQRIRKYDSEKQHSHWQPTLAHPLLIRTSAITTNAHNQKLVNGPLNSASSTRVNNEEEKAKAKKKKSELDFIDPLGAALNDLTDSPPHTSKSYQNGPTKNAISNTLDINENDFHSILMAPEEPELVDFDSWRTKRQKILSKFTTTQKLSIVSSFLPGGIPLETKFTYNDKTAVRMEQFDDDSNMTRTTNLTQHEYIERVNQLNAALLAAWAEDQRVESVKIVIQCCKMLSDSSVTTFYPSQFVLITDILDTFGKLVYDRLWSKANAELKQRGRPLLTSNFDYTDVPEATQETARNWFYKIISVRELLPRFYVEAAIVKCERFMKPVNDRFDTSLHRLATMLRGVGDPIVAAYARCYLCRVGILVSVTQRHYIWRVVNDWMQTWLVANYAKNYDLSVFNAALEWVLQCLSYGIPSDDLAPLLEYCKQPKLFQLLLSPLLSSLPAHHIAANSLELCRQIVEDKSVGEDAAAVSIQTLGSRLLEAEPPPDVQRAILKNVWKRMMRFESLTNYMNCAEVWLSFTCRHFGIGEVNTLLEDLIRHVQPDQAFLNFYPQLLNILQRMVDNIADFHSLFSMERFLTFLDLLRKDNLRLKASKMLLNTFVRFNYKSESVEGDLQLSNHVMYLCKSLHDSLNALSLQDELRDNVVLICRALDRFSFKGQHEHALNYLVEARGNFSNLDDYVVHRMNHLAMDVKQGAVDRMTRKTAHLLRACVANTFITIPSIADVLVRIRLYTNSASVALICNCLPQCDALMRAAISLIPEMSSLFETAAVRRHAVESQICECVSALLSLLLVVPDPPDYAQPLFLFKGLLNAIDSDLKATLQIRCLSWLSTASQPDFPYHVEGIESNDTLYGGSFELLSVVQTTADHILGSLLTHIDKLGQSAERRTSVVVQLLDCIVVNADVESDDMCNLLKTLYSLAANSTKCDRQKLRGLALVVRTRGAQSQSWRALAEHILKI